MGNRVRAGGRFKVWGCIAKRDEGLGLWIAPGLLLCFQKI